MTVRHLHHYSSLGFPLFPCRSRDAEELKPDGKPVHKAKSPLTRNGYYDATCDMAQLEAWHRQHSDCAWGTPTSSLRGVLDIDPKHDGLRILADLEAKHGALPKTWRVRTGSGGLHYWFKFPEGTRGWKVCGDACEVKADGGYVIVPPSRVWLPNHEQAYRWEVKPWECEIAHAPSWLLTLRCSEKPKAKAEAFDPWAVPEAESFLAHEGAEEGSRHDMLCHLTGVHLHRGDCDSTILEAAEQWAKKCNPPLEEHEWRRPVEGIIAKERSKAPCRGVEFEEVPCNGSMEEGEKSIPCFPSSSPTVSSSWPVLSPDARHGLFGEMLSAVERDGSRSCWRASRLAHLLRQYRRAWGICASGLSEASPRTFYGHRLSIRRREGRRVECEHFTL